jgi:hypothetical protein
MGKARKEAGRPWTTDEEEPTTEKKSTSKALKEIPHNGKKFKVDSVVTVGRATHHYFTDDDGVTKDYLVITPKRFVNEV